MRVYRTKPGVHPTDTKHRLFLHAENPRDTELLAQIVDKYQTTNAGKDGTEFWQHVGIELRPLEVSDAKENI